MKKYMLLSLLLFVSIFKSLGQCDNGIVYSPGFYTKKANYDCHQYVKAALIGNWVNLETGLPTHPESAFLNFPGQVATDQNFIRVCSISDARAVVPAPYGNTAFHSALILDNGIFASTPDGSTQYIYKHQNPRTFTPACIEDEQYYAAIPGITLSGPTATNQGAQVTFTLTNSGQPFPSFLQLNSSNWKFDSQYFTEVTGSKTSTSITLTAKNVTGYYNIKYNLKTGCNDITQDYSYRIKSIQVLPNCTGTLNGGPLYTFSTVPPGPNQIAMYLSSWTWVKTSGNASWNTSSGGKNMTFTISSGCATFNAYNSSCNLTFTFCKGSYLMAYAVIDMKTLKVIKEGIVEDIEETNTLLDGLPDGVYIVNIGGNRTRYVKSN